MEVKIGIVHSNEITVDTEDDVDAVQQKVAEALANGTVLTMKDQQGRVLLVPSEKLAYVDIAATRRGKVGFGAS